MYGTIQKHSRRWCRGVPCSASKGELTTGRLTQAPTLSFVGWYHLSFTGAGYALCFSLLKLSFEGTMALVEAWRAP